MNFPNHYIYLFMFLFCSMVFINDTNAVSSGPSPLDGLKTISKQNLNLTVQGDVIEMAISSMSNLVYIDGEDPANGAQNHDIEFVLKKLESDNLGFKHIRLEQRYKGLPVVGAECIVHINNRNIIYRINGKYLPDFKAPLIPDINADAALQIGLEEYKDMPGLQVSKQPSLVIYGQHLAYHYVISYKDNEGVEPGQWWYYVDAQTGEIIDRYNNIQYPVH